MIVGGAGHTTQTLRDVMHRHHPDIDTDGRCEADIFADYLRIRHGLEPDYLERESTNCGNNITNMLDLLRAHGEPCRSVILIQDATMQRRMAAGLRRHAPDTIIVNYAAYRTTVVPADTADAAGISGMDSSLGAAGMAGPSGASGTADALGPSSPSCGLRYLDPPAGMWDMNRYLTLLMGEIPRLRDDANGYGPAGRGYIAHEDIPESVASAHARLSGILGLATREADPAFASH
nr:ElyC/SanA/YdcF family protein [Bifidobacterium amazonense]